MTIEQTINSVIEAGNKSRAREQKCKETGGHYRDKEVDVNGKPGWRCRCGLLAPKTAKCWEQKSGYKIYMKGKRDREIQEKITKVYDEITVRYISSTQMEKLEEKGWWFYPIFRGYIDVMGSKHISVEDKIKELLETNHMVRGCYMASSIRDAHDFYIRARKRKGGKK